ncbi:Sulfur carrier protein ThiS [Castellaniella defragrans 65Phen]|uniref:Sulfur carrier protein ThiS n=2 Tax=Castellaniella defragrans TaxID=75697 RepID=W8X0R8_CASD6|nr:sulfur carrier protein ThiS [Castellaniella defragrans]KAB0624484.1 sulfur carrier protein ThiS [Castellaniella defragrans]MBB6082486.1 sulfur carrier protein [Castellaniella defragrans]CDM25648.1 Sulfur carrier protein ThiS [Castellaniella defragrans 65Phen]
MSLNILLNGTETALDGVRTVHDLVVRLGYEGKRIAVERNGDIVPRSQHAQAPLAEGDRIEIVVAVGGG